MIKNTPLVHFILSFVFASSMQAQITIPTDESTTPNVVPTDQVAISPGVADEDISLVLGRVFNVFDGDTISIQDNGSKVYNIRFQGIDAPESMQSYGKESREALYQLLYGKTVVVVIDKKDSYNRYIADVYLDGQNIGLMQLRAGMAWHFKKYAEEQTPENRKRYAQAELAAKTAQVGLWKEKDPKSPWDYRAAFDTNKNGIPTTANADHNENEVKGKNDENKGLKAEDDNNNDKDKGKTNKAKGIEYVKGPRGGCYYINASGTKTYVKDKSLCDN